MKKIFSIILAAFALTSCVDTVILPENKTLDEDFWKKKREVESVVATAYSQLRDATFQKNIIVWSDFRSDELVLSSDFKNDNATTLALKEIYSAQIQPNNIFTGWAPLYSCINYCNLVIEKAKGVMEYDPNYTIGDYQANYAQVKALRALCYFYLVRVFRDVPVTPGAYFNSSADLNAAPQAPAKVLQMCIDDLNEVEPFAPTTDAYGDERDRGYFNKDGINALLADIYLWRASVNHDLNDYQAAVECCDKVIAAKKAAHKFDRFELNPVEQDYYLSSYSKSYSDIFGSGAGCQNAEESIFEIQYKSNSMSNDALAQMYYSYDATGNKNWNRSFGYMKTTTLYGDYNASGEAKNLFKNTNDMRLFDFMFDANANVEQHAVRKFAGLASRPSNTAEAYNNSRQGMQQDWIVYRLADVMLMKAEALVQLDQLDEAFDLVAVIENRSLINTSSALKKTSWIDNMEALVLIERARELCFEGKRWFDLLRYNYRHMEGVDYSKLMTQTTTFANNSSEFFELALSKYASSGAIKAKMPTEPYLYMPYNEDEVELNSELTQNPAYKSKSKR